MAAAAAWNKQGTHFAFLERGSNYTSIRVYEYVAGRLQLRHILPATNQFGDWLSWSPDGKRLVAGQSERLIVWQLDGRTARVVAERKLPENFFAQWCPISPWIAISTTDGVQLWNPDTQEFGAKLELPRRVSIRRVTWRPDGARLAVEEGKQEIRIWDPASGAVAQNLLIETPLAPGRGAFAWSPDGALLAVYRSATGSEKNHQVEIWDAEQGMKKVALQGTPSGPSYDLFFVDGGRNIANGLFVWNAADGKPLGQRFKDVIPTYPGLVVPGPQPHLITAAEGRANVLFKVQIGNTQTGTAATVLEGLPEAESIAWNPDGRTIAVGVLDKTLRFLSATDGAPRTLIKNLVHPMGTIAWSADGRRLACAMGQILYVADRSAAGKVQIWDIPAGIKSKEFTVSQHEVGSLGWSRDGKYLAAAGDEDEPVQIYLDGETKVFRSLPKPNSGRGIATIAWSPDNRHLAVGLIPGGVTVYEALTGKARTVVSETVNISARIERLSFSPTGDRFVFSSVGPQIGRVYTLDGKPEFEIPNAGRSIVTWSPDDRWIVASHESLEFYNAVSGATVGRVQLPQTGVMATFQSWSPDGQFLAYAQQVCTVGIVDAERREVVWTAILLPNGESAVINAAGQMTVVPPTAETELCYVCETSPDVFEMLSPSEFRRRPPPLPATTRTANPTVAASSPPGGSSGTKSTSPSFFTETAPPPFFTEKSTTPPSGPGGVVYVDDIQEVEWKWGHGPLGTHGAGYSGKPILWHGRTIAHSLYTSPKPNTPETPNPASVAYALDARYESLSATVGIADSSNGSNSPLTFRVLGDGRELWKSPPIQKPTDEATFSVSVADVRELRLEVAAAAGATGAHAVWIEPRLTANVATKPGGPKTWETPDFQKWIADVRKLPVEKQIEAVSQKLAELNQGFDGKLIGPDNTPSLRIENDTITELKLIPDGITDLAPLRVWMGLKKLQCPGTPGKGTLFDLSPLKGMQLTSFQLSYTKVSDLSPLAGMPLTLLNTDAKVTDFSFLSGMPLKTFYGGFSSLSDLSMLRGMPLETLHLSGSQVSDLSPLKECKNLKTLNVRRTKVTAAQIAALQLALPNCKIEWDDPAKPAAPAPAASGTK